MKRYKITLYVRGEDVSEKPWRDVGNIIHHYVLPGMRSILEEAIGEALEDAGDLDDLISIQQDDEDIVASRVEEVSETDGEDVVADTLMQLSWEELCDAGRRLKMQIEPCFDDREWAR